VTPLEEEEEDTYILSHTCIFVCACVCVYVSIFLFVFSNVGTGLDGEHPRNSVKCMMSRYFAFAKLHKP
jgi:hypothetical protein